MPSELSPLSSTFNIEKATGSTASLQHFSPSGRRPIRAPIWNDWLACWWLHLKFKQDLHYLTLVAKGQYFRLASQIFCHFTAKIRTLKNCIQNEWKIVQYRKLDNIVYHHNLSASYLSPGFSFMEVDRILDFCNILSPPQNLSMVKNIIFLINDNEHYITQSMTSNSDSLHYNDIFTPQKSVSLPFGQQNNTTHH